MGVLRVAPVHLIPAPLPASPRWGEETRVCPPLGEEMRALPALGGYALPITGVNHVRISGYDGYWC